MTRSFVSGREVHTADVTGRLYPGLGDGPHPGVLVLHGGGGAGGYETEYAALLAEHGYTVLCVAYFGAPGVTDTLHEIPLSTFADAADWLLDRPDVRGERVGVVGFSRGGEASLLVGSYLDVAGPVVSYVPSCYVWPAPSWMDGVPEGCPTWTLDGEALPFLPVDPYVTESDDVEDPLTTEPPNAGTLAVERSTAAEKERAAIPVEDIDGPVLLVSGGQDIVWPSADLASRAAARLDTHDHLHSFEHRSYPEAGHAIRVPYRFDSSDDPAERHRFGGTTAANARAAADAWEGALEYLSMGLRA